MAKDEFTSAEGRRAIALALAVLYHAKNPHADHDHVVDTAKHFHTYIVNGNPPKD